MTFLKKSGETVHDFPGVAVSPGEPSTWRAEAMGDEEWRGISGAPGYMVSSCGRVRGPSGRILRGGFGSSGYQVHVLSLGSRSRRRTRYTHDLVLRTFVGDPRPGHQCRHLNGDQRDNRLENLTWGTPSENHMDRVLHGTNMEGESNGRAKLTRRQAEEIKRRMLAGESGPKIAKEFGISTCMPYLIRDGRAWKCLEDA